MAYLTSTYIKKHHLRIITGSALNESLKKYASSESTVFLSHRHKDHKLVEDVKGILSNEGVDVYIDTFDHKMPDQTSDDTAKRIKNKIDKSSKFILLATPNSLDSKWIPWDLGLGDGMKGIHNVAILPYTEYDNIWPEREYYQIYGRIETELEGNWIYFPPSSNKGTLLKNWLQNN